MGIFINASLILVLEADIILFFIVIAKFKNSPPKWVHVQKLCLVVRFYERVPLTQLGFFFVVFEK